MLIIAKKVLKNRYKVLTHCSDNTGVYCLNLPNFLPWGLKQYSDQKPNFLPAFSRENAEFSQKYPIFVKMTNFLT